MDVTAGAGICLAVDQGIVTTYSGKIFDDNFEVQHTFPLPGRPSRARHVARRALRRDDRVRVRGLVRGQHLLHAHDLRGRPDRRDPRPPRGVRCHQQRQVGRRHQPQLLGRDLRRRLEHLLRDTRRRRRHQADRGRPRGTHRTRGARTTSSARRCRRTARGWRSSTGSAAASRRLVGASMCSTSRRAPRSRWPRRAVSTTRWSGATTRPCSTRCRAIRAVARYDTWAAPADGSGAPTLMVHGRIVAVDCAAAGSNGSRRGFSAVERELVRRLPRGWQTAIRDRRHRSDSCRRRSAHPRSVLRHRARPGCRRHDACAGRGDPVGRAGLGDRRWRGAGGAGGLGCRVERTRRRHRSLWRGRRVPANRARRDQPPGARSRTRCAPRAIRRNASTSSS